MEAAIAIIAHRQGDDMISDIGFGPTPLETDSYVRFICDGYSDTITDVWVITITM